jgi:1-acyl-sn-glycerol-3-phosphate acyltransferase
MVVAAAADYFFGNQVTATLSSLAMGAFPIERSRVSRDSAEQASELVADGWSLLIFPEGGRSPDGWGQGHRGGAAFLSLRTGAPVVPVHLAGTDRIYPRGASRLRPGRTTVTFGHPLRPAEGDDARRFAATIEAAVAGLADEAGNDWWTARRRAAAGTTPPLTGPAGAGWRRAWALGDRRGRTRTRRTWPEL